MSDRKDCHAWIDPNIWLTEPEDGVLKEWFTLECDLEEGHDGPHVWLLQMQHEECQCGMGTRAGHYGTPEHEAWLVEQERTDGP